MYPSTLPARGVMLPGAAPADLRGGESDRVTLGGVAAGRCGPMLRGYALTLDWRRIE